MASPILARADALMQRRRQGGETDEIPILTDAIDFDDDIPVLLDVEAPAIAPDTIVAAPPVAEAPTPAEANSPTPDPAFLELLVRELARRVEQRLATELPRIIQATVRDFLAEQDTERGA